MSYKQMHIVSLCLTDSCKYVGLTVGRLHHYSFFPPVLSAVAETLYCFHFLQYFFHSHWSNQDLSSAMDTNSSAERENVVRMSTAIHTAQLWLTAAATHNHHPSYPHTLYVWMLSHVCVPVAFPVFRDQWLKDCKLISQSACPIKPR